MSTPDLVKTMPEGEISDVEPIVEGVTAAMQDPEILALISQLSNGSHDPQVITNRLKVMLQRELNQEQELPSDELSSAFAKLADYIDDPKNSGFNFPEFITSNRQAFFNSSKNRQENYISALSDAIEKAKDLQNLNEDSIIVISKFLEEYKKTLKDENLLLAVKHIEDSLGKELQEGLVLLLTEHLTGDKKGTKLDQDKYGQIKFVLQTFPSPEVINIVVDAIRNGVMLMSEVIYHLSEKRKADLLGKWADIALEDMLKQSETGWGKSLFRSKATELVNKSDGLRNYFRSLALLFDSSSVVRAFRREMLLKGDVVDVTEFINRSSATLDGLNLEDGYPNKYDVPFEYLSVSERKLLQDEMGFGVNKNVIDVDDGRVEAQWRGDTQEVLNNSIIVRHSTQNVWREFSPGKGDKVDVRFRTHSHAFMINNPSNELSLDDTNLDGIEASIQYDNRIATLQLTIKGNRELYENSDKYNPPSDGMRFVPAGTNYVKLFRFLEHVAKTTKTN